MAIIDWIFGGVNHGNTEFMEWQASMWPILDHIRVFEDKLLKNIIPEFKDFSKSKAKGEEDWRYTEVLIKKMITTNGDLIDVIKRWPIRVKDYALPAYKQELKNTSNLILGTRENGAFFKAYDELTIHLIKLHDKTKKRFGVCEETEYIKKTRDFVRKYKDYVKSNVPVKIEEFLKQ